MALLVVGGGLFGSLAAAYARHRGIEAIVYDAGLPGAASPAAAGLFCEAWAGRKYATHFREALGVLETLYDVCDIHVEKDDGTRETLRFVPPREILEPAPLRETVTAIGDGWLETASGRRDGTVYVAAGVWCDQFAQGLGIVGKAGAALLFPGESRPRIRRFDSASDGVHPHRIDASVSRAFRRDEPAGSRGFDSVNALAFVRDPGFTYFNDGTAEPDYTVDHERRTLERAAAMGLADPTVRRLWGIRPYTSGGPIFRRLGERTWLATGGRKLGTVIGAAFARRLVEDCGAS